MELVNELRPYRQWINGKTLNAGCGKRFVNLGTETIRLDLNPRFASSVDVVADVHRLPFADNTFDTVLSIAVLEHTRFAWEVAREFHRVLRSGGTAIVAIPFMQPQHGAPNDFVRFTGEGIRALMEWAHFEVVLVRGCHSVGYVTEWFFRELTRENVLLRRLMLPIRRTVFPLMRQGKLMSHTIENLTSAYYVVARK
ncbi:MAG: class I SAM-dependent methyltransferase [Anaerolineae bacterium]|nr:class I SAM-dependent methyltransferase [Anaerolineae bacterium]